MTAPPVHVAHVDEKNPPTRAWIDCDGRVIASYDIDPTDSPDDVRVWFQTAMALHVAESHP